MSVRTKQCWECKQTVYTIEGKFAGMLKNGRFEAFTNKDGTPKMQEYNDMGGEQAHYITCPVKLARKQAQSGGQQRVQAPPSQQGQQQFQNKETSQTYVPEGYIQQNQNLPLGQQGFGGFNEPRPTVIPTPQPPAEPSVISQIQTTLESIVLTLKDIKEGQEAMWERIDFLYQEQRSAALAKEQQIGE